LAVHSIHPPFTASLFAIPRAVCERYKTDRRCSSHGLGFLAPAGMGPPTWKSGLSPPLNPQAERRVSPSVVCVHQEAATCTQSGGLLFRVGRPRCFHLALRGRVLFTPGMPLGDGMLGTEETKPGEGRASRMPCCPPGSPHMRLQVSRGCSLKSLSRGSCLAPGVRESLCHHPQASSFPLPTLASSWAYVFCQLPDRAMPREPTLPSGSARRGFLIYWAWPWTAAWQSHSCSSSQGLAELHRGSHVPPNNVLGLTNKQ